LDHRILAETGSSMSTVVAATYAGAETRGLLRQWKIDLADKYKIINRTFGNRVFGRDVEDLCMRGSDKGRRRAFARINGILSSAGATQESVHLAGKRPMALWSTLKPRGCLTLNPKPDDPGHTQDCISVNYFLIGNTDYAIGLHGEGMWTLEIPDHALGRLLHRTGNDVGTATNAIMGAHRAVLQASQAHIGPDGRFLLPAGIARQFGCPVSDSKDVRSLRVWKMA
jgi:hypothetical protein